MHVKAAATCVTAGPDGVRVRWRQGEVWPADHPIVRHRPGLFVALDGTPAVAPVETADAEPVPVKRGPGRPRKTTGQ